MLLDTAVIEEVRETLGDDVYRGFAARMLAEVAATTSTLHEMLAKGDLESLAKAAHRTSGSAAGIGAKGLHALLKDIENASRSVTASTSVATLIDVLPSRAEETRKALDALFSG